MPLIFTPEYYTTASGGSLLYPTLVKDVTVTQVSEYVPPLNGISPIAFRMFATPPPLGYTYRQDSDGTNLLPNSMATFAGWPQIVKAPTEYGRTQIGWVYQPLEDWLNAGYGNTAIPFTWIPVYDNVTGGLRGWEVPVYGNVAQPPRYYGPIAHMEFVRFPNNTKAPNGYPLAEGVIRGYFEAPTVSGPVAVWGDYRKDSKGVWQRTNWDGLPAGYVMSGFAHVVAMENFPGRPPVPAKPAVYDYDYHLGWNAGANSIGRLDGDVRVRFFPAIKAAGAVGFAPDGPRDVGDFRTLSHCFYFDTAGDGSMQAVTMEYGRAIGARHPYTSATAFEIRREDNIVSYLVGGAVVRVSSVPSGAPVMVGASLYRGEDGVF